LRENVRVSLLDMRIKNDKFMSISYSKEYKILIHKLLKLETNLIM